MSSKNLPPLDNDSFLNEFEQLTLNPAYFSHRGHIRIAWLYLISNDLETAADRICKGIKAYAESLGATQKFNLTLTDAFVRIMANRIKKMPEKNWQIFLQENTDLVDDAPTLLSNHFSDELLYSESARVRIMNPDRSPLV